MKAPSPLSVRLGVACFRAAARLLPPSFRDTWFSEATEDARRTLAAEHDHGRRRKVLLATTSLVLDTLMRAPGEWLAATRARRARVGAGAWSWSALTLRACARSLRRRPWYTSTATLTLALGIGSTVAISTVVDAVLLRPLPFQDSDRIVSIHHRAPGIGIDRLEQSPGMIRFYRERARFLDDVTAYDVYTASLAGAAEPARVRVVAATPEIFGALRIEPVRGRRFDDADAVDGAAPVALITHETWAERFALAPEALGSSIRIDGVPTEIIGVLPPGFVFVDPRAVALVPLSVDPNGRFGAFRMLGLARLAEGVTLEQARAGIEALQADVPAFFEDISADFLRDTGWGVTLERLRDRIVPGDVGRTLWIVLGTVAFVLLIACANVANLFLVRAESRARELAVRTALGAGRASVAATFLGEALLLSLAGGALGVLLATAAVELLVSWAPSSLPRLHEVTVDGASVGVAALVSLLVTASLGVLTIGRLPDRLVARTLRAGGRTATSGADRHRTRNALVVSQFALAFVLLVASGLMLRTFAELRAVRPGVGTDDVLTVAMSLNEGVGIDEAVRFYERVAAQVAALPGVHSVGLSTSIPLTGGDWNGGSFYIESRPRGEEELPPVASYKAVGAEYLEALDHPLLEGRRLERSDWEGGPPVALVNRAFAEAFLDGDALREGIKWDEDADFARIVGVVADVHELGLDEAPPPVAYLPLVVGDWGYPGLATMNLFVESETAPTAHVDAIRDIVRSLDSTVPVAFRTMDEVLDRSIAETSLTLTLIGIAAATALILGAVGLFGVVSYVVAQRTREIGVRVVLGAGGADIRGLVVRRAAALAAMGLALGLVGAAATTRVMESLLFGVGAGDPVAFGSAGLVLAAVAAVASWLPARRAARLDPIEALRSE